MSDKLKKIFAGILGIYLVFAVVFCAVAQEHINYENADAIFYGTEHHGETAALVGEETVSQSFVVTADRITFISVKLTTFGNSLTKGKLTVELVDPASGKVLDRAKCELKNVADQAWRNFRLGTNVEKYVGRELTLRFSTNLKASEELNKVGIAFQEGSVEGAGLLSVSGEATEGTLNFSVSGANKSGGAMVYYGIFAVVGVLLALYFAKQLAVEKKGGMTVGLRFAHTIEKYWFLMEQLIARDFKTKYKRSVLGVFWSFLNPLLMMLVQYFVFVNLFKFNVENYAVYLLTGIVMFNGMNDTTTQAMSSITGNASLITKVYVPKYIYPISKVFSTSINLLLSMMPLMLVAIFTGLLPKWSWLMMPYVLICQIVFMVGLAFILSSLMVFFRDVQFLWGVFSTAWMYATPIMYPIDILPGFMQKLELVNPMYYYITFMRTIIIDGVAPGPRMFAACALFAAAVLVIGSIIFKKTQDQFVLYI